MARRPLSSPITLPTRTPPAPRRGVGEHPSVLAGGRDRVRGGAEGGGGGGQTTPTLDRAGGRRRRDEELRGEDEEAREESEDESQAILD